MHSASMRWQLNWRKSSLTVQSYRDDFFAWEQCKAKELFESKSKKDHSDLPILSATQENGIVFRNDLDIDIKFDTHALSNYKVVSPGDYIISLRSFQGGFELSEKLGIISPAYTVFAFNNQEKSRQKDTFWKYLFKRYDFIESLKRLTFGIRDGKAISFNQFSTLKLSFPNFDEQNKIATLLHELDRTITLHDQKLSLLKRVKQTLLQKMFIWTKYAIIVKEKRVLLAQDSLRWPASKAVTVSEQISRP